MDVALLRNKTGEVQEGGSRAASANFTFFLIFIYVFYSVLCIGGLPKNDKKQDSSRDRKMIQKWCQHGPKMVHFCDPLWLMLALLGFMLA